MPRVKRGTKRHAKRLKILKRAKGFVLTKSKLYRSAKESVERALKYSYRDRKTRKSLFLFDRIKVTLILVVYFGFAVVLKHADIPIMTWEEALRDQLSAKWWPPAHAFWWQARRSFTRLTPSARRAS